MFRRFMATIRTRDKRGFYTELRIILVQILWKPLNFSRGCFDALILSVITAKIKRGKQQVSNNI